jgi:hypothetical protein
VTTCNDKKEKLKTLTIRVLPSWIARIDARLAKMELSPTRTLFVIDAINRRLDELDAREAREGREGFGPQKPADDVTE